MVAFVCAAHSTRLPGWEVDRRANTETHVWTNKYGVTMAGFLKHDKDWKVIQGVLCPLKDEQGWNTPAIKLFYCGFYFFTQKAFFKWYPYSNQFRLVRVINTVVTFWILFFPCNEVEAYEFLLPIFVSVFCMFISCGIFNLFKTLNAGLLFCFCLIFLFVC